MGSSRGRRGKPEVKLAQSTPLNFSAPSLVSGLLLERGAGEGRREGAGGPPQPHLEFRVSLLQHLPLARTGCSCLTKTSAIQSSSAPQAEEAPAPGMGHETSAHQGGLGGCPR